MAPERCFTRENKAISRFLCVYSDAGIKSLLLLLLLVMLLLRFSVRLHVHFQPLDGLINAVWMEETSQQSQNHPHLHHSSVQQMFQLFGSSRCADTHSDGGQPLSSGEAVAVWMCVLTSEAVRAICCCNHCCVATVQTAENVCVEHLWRGKHMLDQRCVWLREEQQIMPGRYSTAFSFNLSVNLWTSTEMRRDLSGTSDRWKDSSFSSALPLMCSVSLHHVVSQDFN